MLISRRCGLVVIADQLAKLLVDMSKLGVVAACCVVKWMEFHVTLRCAST